LLLPLFILFTVTPLLSLAEQEGQEKEISFVKEIFNFHIIDPNVMRGSQPSEESLKLLKDYLV